MCSAFGGERPPKMLVLQVFKDIRPCKVGYCGGGLMVKKWFAREVVKCIATTHSAQL